MLAKISKVAKRHSKQADTKKQAMKCLKQNKKRKKKKTATKAWHDLCNGKSRRYAQQRRLSKQLLLQLAVFYNVRWNILKHLMPGIALDHTQTTPHSPAWQHFCFWTCEVRWMRSLICLARWPLCLFVISDSDLDWVRGCCCCCCGSGALFQLLFPCACLPAHRYRYRYKSGYGGKRYVVVVFGFTLANGDGDSLPS